MYRYLQKCLYRGLCPKLSTNLNIFGMITKRNQYKGFTTQESIIADKIVDYLDRFSFNVTKKTVIVLDNASVH